MCVINRDNQVIVTDRSEEIESLQAEIRKKDQELDALRKSWFTENQARELAEAEMRSEAKARTEQQAYIGRLEAAFLKSEAERSHYESHDVCGVSKAFMDGEGFEYNQMLAKEALEKLRTG